ncbi:MAG: hypothetical protein ACE5JF_12235, partial [Anaerolineales bacterium]
DRLDDKSQSWIEAIEEALTMTGDTKTGHFEAESNRLKGDILLKQGADRSDVERSYQNAIDTARKQKAKWWELRATVSLARLWRDQGRADEARQRLSEIFNWFTEGFDTLDLKEAKALLDELG